MSTDTKQKVRSGGHLRLHPWHFFPQHLKRGEDGKWSLDYSERVQRRYIDFTKPSGSFAFPPPKMCVNTFIDEQLLPGFTRPQERWAEENRETEMPDWMLNILALDSEMAISESDSTVLTKGGITANHINSGLQKCGSWQARAHHINQEKKGQEEKHKRAMEDGGVGEKHSDQMKHSVRTNTTKS